MEEARCDNELVLQDIYNIIHTLHRSAEREVVAIFLRCEYYSDAALQSEWQE